MRYVLMYITVMSVLPLESTIWRKMNNPGIAISIGYKKLSWRSYGDCSRLTEVGSVISWLKLFTKNQRWLIRFGGKLEKKLGLLNSRLKTYKNARVTITWVLCVIKNRMPTTLLKIAELKTIIKLLMIRIQLYRNLVHFEND